MVSFCAKSAHEPLAAAYWAGAQAKGVAANCQAVDAFAANVLPIVRQIQAAGATTFRAIATALNNRGVRTARGGAWHDSTVRNLRQSPITPP
jgi:Recombinase